MTSTNTADPLRVAAQPLLEWLTMQEAHRECAELSPLEPNAIVLQFMGSGASCRVTWGELTALRRALEGETDG